MHAWDAEVSCIDIAAIVCAFGRGARALAALSCLASERWDPGCFVRCRILDDRCPVFDRCWLHGTALCATGGTGERLGPRHAARLDEEESGLSDSVLGLTLAHC
eukprot:891649-Prymnesium_polylepis.1